MSRFASMFAKGRIGKMVTKNRLVMPPMVRNYADAKGLVTQRYIDHITSIAQGGVGMMILEAIFISPDGRGFANQLGIHTDATIPGLKKLAAAAHKYGAKIGCQVYHAGRQTSPLITKLQPIAPSPIPDSTMQAMPHQLTVAEIKKVIRNYALAAGRAKKANLDFIELHGAHGYLITQFLSPFSNHRKDDYGGTPEKRQRFLIEVFSQVREMVGPDFPIIVRLSADEMVKGGLTLKDTIKTAKLLEFLGANALHISVGNYTSYAQGYMIPPMAIEDAPLLKYASAVKKSVGIPVIAVGKLRDPRLVERAIKNKSVDFAAIGRTLLADPQWPNKVKAGKLEDINKCIACNQSCITRLFEQKDVQCTVNPKTSREGLFAKKLGKKKKVLIIGGGPAGLSAAKIAAERGHKVTLYEKSKKLGGQVIAAAALPYRRDWDSFLQTLIHDVKKLGITIHAGQEFNPKLIGKNKFDAAIVAMGSSTARPNIPGIDRANVVFARDILEKRSKAKGRVVVAGGGCMGSQVAEFLAIKKHPVSIVEATANIAMEAPSDDRSLLLGRLNKLGVKVLTNTKVGAIGPRSVSVEGKKGASLLAADTIVLCLGARSNDGITGELKKLVKSVTVVGDAKKPRRVPEAVEEGALAALSI